jgi:hypothetical protein
VSPKIENPLAAPRAFPGAGEAEDCPFRRADWAATETAL